jgi:hypothetical protein
LQTESARAACAAAGTVSRHAVTHSPSNVLSAGCQCVCVCGRPRGCASVRTSSVIARPPAPALARSRMPLETLTPMHCLRPLQILPKRLRL